MGEPRAGPGMARKRTSMWPGLGPLVKGKSSTAPGFALSMLSQTLDGSPKVFFKKILKFAKKKFEL